MKRCLERYFRKRKPKVALLENQGCWYIRKGRDAHCVCCEIEMNRCLCVHMCTDNNDRSAETKYVSLFHELRDEALSFQACRGK